MHYTIQYIVNKSQTLLEWEKACFNPQANQDTVSQKVLQLLLSTYIYQVHPENSDILYK